MLEKDKPLLLIWSDKVYNFCASVWQITWFKGIEMISYGKTVYRYKSKLEIEKPVATETNLVIKTVEQSDAAIYSCKNVTDTIGKRQLIVESKWF